MGWLENLGSWIKLDPRYLLPVAAATGLLLFEPSQFVATLGLSSLVSEWRPLAGLVFLVSICLLASHALIAAALGVRGMNDKARRFRRGKEHLRNLSPVEKELVAKYLLSGNKTHYFEASDGVANGLAMAGILFTPSSIGDVFSWAFNVQPWAWKYLQNHPELVLSPEDVEEFRR